MDVESLNLDGFKLFLTTAVDIGLKILAAIAFWISGR